MDQFLDRMWSRRFVAIFGAIVSIVGLVSCQDFPVDPELGDVFMPLIEAMTHLDKYGYLHLDPAKTDTNLDMDATRNAITKYQTFYGLPVTNIVDSTTLDHMRKPRCGCMDPVDRMVGEWDTQDIRYATAGGKWNKTDLTFRVTRIPSTLDKRAVKRLVRKAFKLWSETTSLAFTEAKKSDDVDILIQFASGFHNGPRNFFDKLGEIAHAFPPVPKEEGYSHLAGHVHLDAQEEWRIEGGDGVTTFDLLPVMLHEIGHALGLSHSTNTESVMTPMITELLGGKKVELSQDDVDGIQSIYGPKMADNISTRKACISVVSPYDAIGNLFGDIYVFKGAKYWRLTSPGVVAASSGLGGELITSKWKDLPSNIDAVYQSTKTWNVVFIKGDSFWVYAGVENHPLLPGYPKPLRLLTLPDGLDAAVHTGDRTYFIKGRLVLEMMEDASQLGARPAQVTEYNQWKKTPKRIDSAFYYDDQIYFVKDDEYYHLPVNQRKVQKDDGASFRSYFLGCQV